MEKVCVEWVDSSVVQGWELQECAERDVAHCSSVGWLLEKTQERVTIAQSQSTTGSIMNTLTIPRGAVTAIITLRQR